MDDKVELYERLNISEILVNEVSLTDSTEY